MNKHQRALVLTNTNQGLALRVLFVCSYGVLRSPTAAHWCAANKGWNTRSAGISNAAVPQLEWNLLAWAQRIYVMEQEHLDYISMAHGDYSSKIRVLHIPDEFDYMDPKLVAMIKHLLAKE